jgi:molybdenum cofactor guanylyltransferase
VQTVTAFVLAGGRSSRMGTDKALLHFGDKSLLQRALQTAAAVAGNVYIVGARERYATFGEVIEDIHPGCGPLGGIHAALTATGTDLNLILSVDMPLMSAEFLTWLIQQAEEIPELIAVPNAAGGLQPLCATYRQAVANIAEKALQERDYKVGHLFARAPTHILAEQEIVAAGFSAEIFQNINTPEEYERCRS